MVGSEKQDFWPKINILKGDQCILRIQRAPIRKKLGKILAQKETFSKEVNGFC